MKNTTANNQQNIGFNLDSNANARSVELIANETGSSMVEFSGAISFFFLFVFMPIISFMLYAWDLNSLQFALNQATRCAAIDQSRLSETDSCYSAIQGNSAADKQARLQDFITRFSANYGMPVVFEATDNLAKRAYSTAGNGHFRIETPNVFYTPVAFNSDNRMVKISLTVPFCSTQLLPCSLTGLNITSSYLDV